MELKLNREGKCYILGTPMKGEPGVFLQLIFDASELDWPEFRGKISGFSSKEQADKARQQLHTIYNIPIDIYEVMINIIGGSGIGEQ